MRSMVEGASHRAQRSSFAPSTAFGGPPPPSHATGEEPCRRRGRFLQRSNPSPARFAGTLSLWERISQRLR